MYRIVDALACVNHWLQFQPDNVRALCLRGDSWFRGRSARNAVTEYMRVIELDPRQHQARWRLALSLLDTARYAEAQEQLERVREQRPDDPDVLARLARCRFMLGRTKEALDLLESALAAHPNHGTLLRTRGQMELLNGRPAEGEKWLARAALELRDDYTAHFALADALRRQGKDKEAATSQARAEQLRSLFDRLNDLTTRVMSERPHDPAVHTDVAEVQLELGRREVARAWLNNALLKDPNYGRAHAALARLYESEGDHARAAAHQSRAGGSSGVTSVPKP
jgi:predicted Zn-dependent protease